MILDEAHITTIAVIPPRRGQKVGKRLLWELLRIRVDAGTKWAVLEVRESNEVARKMMRASASSRSVCAKAITTTRTMRRCCG